MALPTAGPRDVVISPQAVGICGTDIHLAEGDYPTGKFPVVPGHEFAGIVEEVGTEVSGFSIGDRVCVDPNISCGECDQCAVGAPNLCRNLMPIGVTVHGAVAERVSVPASVVFPLPQATDWSTAALIEPLACVLHGLSRISSVRGQRVLIYGAGSIGLLATELVLARGARSVEIVEPSPVRREAAFEFGAIAAHAPGERPASDDIDIVLEASGHPAAVADALKMLANRGTLLQMGVVSPTQHIDLFPYDLFDRELTIVGSQSLAGSYSAAIDEIRDLPGIGERMVTHTFGLRDYEAALTAARSETVRKVLILPQQ